MTAATTRRSRSDTASPDARIATAPSASPARSASPASTSTNIHTQAVTDETQPAAFVSNPFRLGPPDGSFGADRILPLVPEAVLRQHHCFVPTDTRFRAAARLLQNAWRLNEGLPLGSYRDGAGRRRKLGSRLTAADGRRGANFISPAVTRLVEKELIYREIGAVIEEERLRQNLLSSQPLCFNLFGPMKLDLGLATAVCDQLLPGFFREVVDVRFEHSPARGHKAFVGDGTAYDVLFRGYTPAGRRAFASIEVKLTEGCTEPLPRFSGCYKETAQSSSLFVDPDDPALHANPIQQLFRQTCLGATMLRNELYDEGIHLLVAPQDNHLAWNAADSFRRHLREPDAGRLPFHAISLETVISAIATAGEPKLARLLHRRYCDYGTIKKFDV